MPIRAKFPVVIQEVVVGSSFCNPPIFRMSWSFTVWITVPEHKNRSALKKAWVQMWKNASSGSFRPIATIIRPSWLEVEKAMIFLMSFCVVAQIALKSVEIAPRHSVNVRICGMGAIVGNIRISRNTPATTIVLEWSRAETGVGPSIAAGSQG